MRDAGEMATLAEQLGRTFEAKVFRTIAMATEPDRREPIVPSSRSVRVTLPQRGTLADLLAEELAAANLTKTR
jgi:hypothetical protein